MHAVADIDIDVSHIARNFRMHIYHLKGLKLASKTQNMRDIAALHNGDSHRWRRRLLVRVGSFASGERNDDSAHRQQAPQHTSYLRTQGSSIRGAYQLLHAPSLLERMMEGIN
jgi:hypothetical protein